MNMLSAMLVHPRRRLPIANALPPWVTSLGLAVTVGIIYSFAARLSLALISRPDGVAVFWPAAGVSSGLLIALRPSAWPPILAGTAIATVIANLLGDRNIWSSVTFALCNAGEPAIVALLLQRFFGSPF